MRAFDSDRTTWAVQASALRTVSNSYNMFVVESFMDEVAHALKRDPLEFRLRCSTARAATAAFPIPAIRPARRPTTTWTGCGFRCRGRNRQKLAAVRIVHGRRCAAARALPSRRRGQGRLGIEATAAEHGMGIAVSSAEERQSPTWVAGIAEVTVDPSTGEYRINKLTIAMDLGTRRQPRRRHGTNSGLGAMGRKSGALGTAEPEERCDPAEQLPRLHAYSSR